MLCALAVVASIATVTPPLGAAPLAEVDVEAFESRAEAWTWARTVLRVESEQQAEDLAAEARQAELDRIAAEEAEQARQAAEAAARATTTTAPPTTTRARPTTTTTTTTTTVAPTTTAGATASAPAEPTPTTEAPAGSPTAAQWEALRQCESSGNYAIVSGDGRYRGAYQFSQATWDWVAGAARPELVGVDPAAASPADQDEMALRLWQRRGWHPWPICGQQAAAA